MSFVNPLSPREIRSYLTGGINGQTYLGSSHGVSPLQQVFTTAILAFATLTIVAEAEASPVVIEVFPPVFPLARLSPVFATATTVFVIFALLVCVTSTSCVLCILTLFLLCAPLFRITTLVPANTVDENCRSKAPATATEAVRLRMFFMLITNFQAKLPN